MDENGTDFIGETTQLDAEIDRIESIREELKERIGWTGEDE